MRIRHIAALATVLLTHAMACHAGTVITFRSDPWCPYNCDPASDRPGYAVEIARIALKDAGYDVDYQLLNWARSLQEARAGKADAVIGAYATDVPGFVIPAEPIGLSVAGFAVRRGSAFHYTGPHALDGRVLGVVATYEFAGELGDYIRANRTDRDRIQLVAGDDALARNMAKLLAGHLDVVMDDADVLAETIATLRLGDKVTVSKAPSTAAVYIAFSPANPLSPHLARILSAGIARMRATGQLAAILARYHVADWAAGERKPPQPFLPLSPQAPGVR